MPTALKMTRPVRIRFMINDSFGTGVDKFARRASVEPCSTPSEFPRDGVPDWSRGGFSSEIVHRP
jgi:hypothetical protein